MTKEAAPARKALTGEERRQMRNDAMRERFRVLYEQQRIRLDDTLSMLEDEFFLSANYIWRIVKE